jgi:hypothetical protein
LIISKRPPYSNTKADADRSRAQIDKLLNAYGINQFQWTQDRDIITLAFKVETEINGVRKMFAFKVSPPTFAKQHLNWNPSRGAHDKVYSPNWAQSYRLLYYWLKAKLEAVAYGLTSIEQEFLSQVLVSLPTGEAKTIGELVANPEIFNKLALEDRT